jgi:hypothetical protein
MKISEFNKPVQKTKQDRTVNPRYKKPDFVKMLSEAERCPLMMRIAAELFRAGISGRDFLDKFHLEGNPMSTQIHAHMVQFDLSRGQDPARVPPVMPVLLRYVPTAKQKELIEKQKKGRPSTEEAKAYLQKLINELQAKGWHEVDFINALRDLVDNDTAPAKTVKIEDFEDDDEPVKGKAKHIHHWHIRIGKKWLEFGKQGDAIKAMEKDDETDGITAPVDVPSKRVHCSYCKFKLTGTCVVVRNGKETEEMHMGCYWMNVANPATVPIGMTVLDAATGKFYTYHGPEKGRWQIKETPNETPDTGTDGGEGVPQAEGENQKPPAAISAPPPK